MSDETKRCPFCAEEIKAQAVLCRFCKADFRTGSGPALAPPPTRTSGGLPTWAIVLIVLGACFIVVPVLAAIAIPAFLPAARASNERNAAASLKTVAAAQADFRSNDRDGNRVNDFWTLDVAGLYTMRNYRDPQAGPIRLIELSVAAADAAPALGDDNAVGGNPAVYGDLRELIDHTPKAGHWYIALRHDASDPNQDGYRMNTQGVDADGKTLAEAAWHVSKFGVLAYPDSLSTGKSAFVINQLNTIYAQHLRGECRNPIRGVPPGVPDAGGLLPAGGEVEFPSDVTRTSFWSRFD